MECPTKDRLLKERSIFRNESDVVPAAFRARNAEILFFIFLKGVSLQRDAEVETREFLEVLSFLSFVVGFPWELVSGRGVFLFKQANEQVIRSRTQWDTSQ